jgi:hypothetical protein
VLTSPVGCAGAGRSLETPGIWTRYSSAFGASCTICGAQLINMASCWTSYHPTRIPRLVVRTHRSSCHPPVHLRDDVIRTESELTAVPIPRASHPDADPLFRQAGLSVDQG